MPQIIFDSHIHLWPGSAANPASHSWMQPGAHLSTQYSINDYVAATAPITDEFDVRGFLYVETDRTIAQDSNGDVTEWAAEPLKEIAFLRRIVEGRPERDEGFDGSQAGLVRGIVAWAPLNRPLDDFLRYMAIMKEVAGEETWSKIRGFRYLVQGITDEKEFRRLLDPRSSSFVSLLRFLGSRGLSFDVGVDQRQGGVWQLELFAETVEQAHKDVQSKDKTTFILSRLIPLTPCSVPFKQLIIANQIISASQIWNSRLRVTIIQTRTLSVGNLPSHGWLSRRRFT
jgi:L-rhamnono-1,4-lactonase